MLKLPQVSLIALSGIGYQTGKNIKALQSSCNQIEFGAVKYIQDGKIDSISKWNYEVFYNLGDYVQTEFALLIHSNGFVVNPECWKDEWLKYDYCGSPFPLPQDDYSYRDINGIIQRVGNSVGLRSKKLMQLPKKLGLKWQKFHGWDNEDGAYSVNYRHIFEENGCKFMPFQEALYFGREHELPENQHIDKTFVFHNYLGRNAMYTDRTL